LFASRTCIRVVTLDPGDLAARRDAGGLTSRRMPIPEAPENLAAPRVN
jgi:hypothetical protein